MDTTVVMRKKPAVTEIRKQQSQEYRYATLYSGDSDECDSPESTADQERTGSESSPPVASIRSKDIKKDGYLQKQGGVQQNQGWKKRWFVFDGKSLKYFPNRQSVVSLRIIPIAIMQNVEPYKEENIFNVKASLDIIHAQQREHKFVLKCRSREFLFATNDLDNSLQWQSYLMAAIIDYQKNKKDYIPQGEMNNPDKSGPMKLNRNRAHYIAALKGKIFRYYYNDIDYNDDSPIHELSMELTNVVEISETSLKLENPMLDQSIILHFNTEVESSAWKIAFENAISNCLGDNMIVDLVREVEGNTQCADCTSHETLWASINLGIVLCAQCAGIHRSLGVNISKTRSLRMDNIFRNDKSVLQLMLGIGNEKSNKMFYHHPPVGTRITSETPSDVRKLHITTKYVDKAFADIITDTSKENLNENLIEAIRKDDISLVIKCIHSGASIMCSTTPSANGRNAIVFADENGRSILKEYLSQNQNTDFSLPFNNIDNLKIDSEGNNRFSEVRRKGIYLVGSLEKTGAKMKGFKRRWCVLHYGKLSYYDSEEMTTRKGCIDMKDIVCVTQIEERTIVRERRFCFELTHKPNKRTYRFSCSSEQSCQEWLVAIAKVISPLEIDYESFSLAGYFFVKLEQGEWKKMWLVLQHHNLIQWNIETRSQEISIILTQDLDFRVENKGEFSAIDETYIDQKKLHGNQRVEISSKPLSLSVSIQGLLSRDTDRLVTLVKLIVT